MVWATLAASLVCACAGERKIELAEPARAPCRGAACDPPPDAAPAAGCTQGSECTSGFCLGGRCCETAAHACGTQCCAGEQVCLSGECVMPGASCRTEDDCEQGHYCETALNPAADSDLTVPPETCMHLPPLEGRCLPAPRVCADGEDASTGCQPRCEFRPMPGALDAVVDWQWGGTLADEFPEEVDVWSTPTVGRVADTNCDGLLDQLDTPNIIFVSANSKRDSCVGAAACTKGVLRVLDGATGKEVWSLERPASESRGFAGVSTALADIDDDGRPDIVAVSGEGRVVVVGGDGVVKRISAEQIPGRTENFGWGGGVAVGDMEGDGFPEIAFGATVFTVRDDMITRRWTGTGGNGGSTLRALSVFADVDMDGFSELVAGNTTYEPDGSRAWTNGSVPNGFPGVADLDLDGQPEVVVVGEGRLFILDGSDGTLRLPPARLGPDGFGGPPTIADFDGDGRAEIGVAQQNAYWAMKPNFEANTIERMWNAPNHDFSSSVTGSTVFDFEGDGAVEVVYNDECFLWVYDGRTGSVRFATPTSSFTATEASIVADVDGDDHADIVMVSNGANPSTWGCTKAPWTQPDELHNRPAWTRPTYGAGYRGITVFRDRENGWVGTRSLWNQHAYFVTNVCDHADDACDPALPTGAIPSAPRHNWQVPWLNNFRQNVQGEHIFDAPDAVVSLSVACTSPLELTASVRNIGQASLPAGVTVVVELSEGDMFVELAEVATTRPLLPGQTEVLRVESRADRSATFRARIAPDPETRSFRECREDNNDSGMVSVGCII